MRAGEYSRGKTSRTRVLRRRVGPAQHDWRVRMDLVWFSLDVVEGLVRAGHAGDAQHYARAVRGELAQAERLLCAPRKRTLT